MRRYLALAGAIGCEVTASLSLKGALDNGWLYVVVAAGYLASFAFLAVTLRLGMGLGVAYGIWGATGVALTAIAATHLFGEPFTALMGVGIALIIAGVLLVELGAQAAHRKAAEVAR